jgi:Ca2+-binding RTX toxin-like protein
MTISWALHDTGYDVPASDLLMSILRNGDSPQLSGGDLVMSAGDYELHLHGTFITDKGKPIAGFITGFDIDHGPDSLVTAINYHIDYVAFLKALSSDTATALDKLFYSDPMVVHGSAQADTFHGGAGNDILGGGGRADTIEGRGGNDYLLGGSGNDHLSGGGGRDNIRGGEGSDVLKGGAGADMFIFDTALGSNNVDKIQDFKVGHDLIGLDSHVFSAIGGSLGPGEFRIGAKALDGNDHIIYNASTGALFYDEDGKGGAAQVKFATLDHNLDLHNTSFFVV